MEERERWESEREGWTRAAQALLQLNRKEAAHWETHDSMTAPYAHMAPDMLIQRLHESERITSALQGEKKALQQKVRFEFIFLKLNIFNLYLAGGHPIPTSSP